MGAASENQWLNKAGQEIQGEVLLDSIRKKRVETGLLGHDANVRRRLTIGKMASLILIVIWMISQ